MEQSSGVDVAWAWLVLGFPVLLMALLLLLGRLERWMIQPDERAAEVSRLLDQADHAEEVEEAVRRLLADLPGRRARALGTRARLAAASSVMKRRRGERRALRRPTR